MNEAVAIQDEISKRLTSSSTYVKRPNGQWVKFWKERTIFQTYKLKFYKNSNERLILHKLTLTKLDAFIWGLLLGSSRTNGNQKIMTVRKETRLYIQQFCKQHEIPFRWERAKLRRKGTHKAYSNRYQVKYVVKLPPIIYRFFKILGLNLKNPNIPSYFSEDLKIELVKGYLHSQKCSLTVRNRVYKYPRFIIKSKYLKRDGMQCRFIDEMRELLVNYGIKTNKIIVKRPTGTCNYLYVDSIKNLLHLIELFELNTLRIQAYLMIRKLRQQDRDFNIKTIDLSELSLFILGLCYLYSDQSNDARNHQVLEYTIFENHLSTSSNNIRRALYHLEEAGFINYFARGKKEFVRVISGYKQKVIKEDLDLVINISQELSFQCQHCDQQLGYLEAWHKDGFYCPECHSTDLEAYEL
ncbi:MAG: hypothetical protein EAX96_14880 [Candidatus Lokiarchaeota archaeon]|nr:hypothetical protein [Candidatus Lokiarchaeota archaeon]